MKIKDYIDIASLYKMYETHPHKEEKVLESLLKERKDMPYKEAQQAILSYLEGLNKSEEGFIARFKFKGVEYGLIPDLDNITTREFLHLKKYENDINNLHKLLAVLYRPIKEQYGKHYSIIDFDEENMNEKPFLDMDVKIWFSIQSFFLTLHRQLLVSTLVYGQEQTKQMKKQVQENE